MTSSLVLHVAGKDYTIPSPPARVGLALQASYVITQARRAKVDPPPYALERHARYDDMTHTLDEDALGPAWAQMIEDDVPLSELRRAAQAAYVWVVTGSDVAAQSIMDPAPAGDGEDDPKGQGSTATAGATTTRKRGSGTGTTSRKGKRTD